MSKSEKVLELLDGYQYKNTTRGIYAYIDTINGREEVPLSSGIFYSVLADDFRIKYDGASISQKTIKECVFNYQGKIIKSQPKVDTKLRIHMEPDGSVIRVDKGDSQYHYFEISSDGWLEKECGDTYFSRNMMQAVLLTPRKNGNLNLIFKYCRIPEGSRNVFLAYLVSCFIDIIHPCLVLQGAAGSSKSTVSTLLKMLIDPCKNNAPCIFPQSEFELKDIYTHMYLAAYDNLDRLSKKQSDMLCSIVTGTQIIKRKLFTDSESCVYNLRQPVILNGISGIVTKEDLLDRSIIINLPSISPEERKSEKTLIRDFQSDLPVILGGIFDILSKTLKIYKEDSIGDAPRLIDFYEYGYYICEAIEKGRGKRFCEEYHQMIDTRDTNVFALYDNPLYHILDVFLEENKNHWKGTMAELWSELWKMDDEFGVGGVPAAPNHLSRILTLMKDSLQKEGIYISYSSNTKNNRFVELWRVVPDTQHTS